MEADLQVFEDPFLSGHQKNMFFVILSGKSACISILATKISTTLHGRELVFVYLCYMRHFSFLTVFIYVALFPMSMRAQSKELKLLDSLAKIINKQPFDTFNVQAQFKVIDYFSKSDYKRAIQECNKALSMSESIQYDPGICGAYSWLGGLHERLSEYDLAIGYYQKSLVLSRKLKDPNGEAMAINNMAIIEMNKGKTEEALNYFKQVLVILQKSKDTVSQAFIYNNLGFIYDRQGKIEEALSNYNLALKIHEHAKDDFGLCATEANIGKVYQSYQLYDFAREHLLKSYKIAVKNGRHEDIGYALNDLGNLMRDLHKKDSAMYYYNEALTRLTKLGNKQGIANALAAIGDIAWKNKEVDLAKVNLEKALALYIEIEDQSNIAIITNQLGEIALSKNKLPEAEKLMLQSYQISKKLGFPKEMSRAAGNLKKLYQQKGNYKEAIFYADIFTTMKDSFDNDESKKLAIKNQYTYDFEKKEAILNATHSAQIDRQHQLRNFLIGGLAIVLFFAVIFFRQRNSIKAGLLRSDELLLNILPEETANELKATGKAQAKKFDSVTVLFTDFKNFTQTAEALSPEQLVQEIDFCYRAFDDIVTKYKIEKIKTMGDSYMCVGGLPKSNTSHPIDVINAGIEIQQFIEQNKINRSANGLPFFEIRIGIHTGPVVAGVVGSKKFAYDIWGETVNVASRMESSGEIGKINISQSTYALVQSAFNCVYRGKVQAKNMQNLDMYFIEV